MPEMVDKIYGIILGDRIMIVYEVAINCTHHMQSKDIKPKHLVF